MRFHRPERELEEALAKQRDHVNDQIINEEGQRARKQIEAATRTSKKERAFNRKARRRKKKGRR